MFGLLETKHLADALNTRNHFLPILCCFSVSLALIYLSGLFATEDQRTAPDVPDIYSSVSRATVLPSPPPSLFDELKGLKNKFDILRIVAYTVVLIIGGTFLLLYLVRNNYVRFIRYWFSAAYFLVLSFFSLLLLKTMLKHAAAPFAIDLVTVVFLLWNICECSPSADHFSLFSSFHVCIRSSHHRRQLRAV